MDNSTLGCLLLIAFVFVAIFAFTRCKLKCGSQENWSNTYGPRGHVLGANANSSTQMNGYMSDWKFKLPTITEINQLAHESGSPMVHELDQKAHAYYAAHNKKEDYTPMWSCGQKCKSLEGQNSHALCLNACMNATTRRAQRGAISMPGCSSDADCNDRELCVTSGWPAYVGNTPGMCMSDNEPGIPRSYSTPSSVREGFRPAFMENRRFTNRPTCDASQFYDETLGRCTDRFQGSSTAFAVHHQVPMPYPSVTIPGTTLPRYGTSSRDPMDVETDYVIRGDQ